MSPSARRRRGFLLLLVAGLAGSMAASRVRSEERAIRGRVGDLVPVVVVRAPISARSHIAPQQLAVARVPARFVPTDAMRTTVRAVGRTALIALPRGAYLTRSAIASSDDPRLQLRRGERAIDVEVSGGARLAQRGGPGSRVDVVVTTEPRNGAPRAFVAADGAELLALRSGDNGHAIATLRVPVKQAVYLTAATSFGRDARLLVRAPGDAGSTGPIGFTAPGM